MGDTDVLEQLVSSMQDAVEKLEESEQESRIQDFNKIKAFILDLQKRIKLEVVR